MAIPSEQTTPTQILHTPPFPSGRSDRKGVGTFAVNRADSMCTWTHCNDCQALARLIHQAMAHIFMHIQIPRLPSPSPRSTELIHLSEPVVRNTGPRISQSHQEKYIMPMSISLLLLEGVIYHGAYRLCARVCLDFCGCARKEADLLHTYIHH